MIEDHKFEGFLFYTKHFSLRVLRNSEYELHFSKLWDTFPRRASSLLSMSTDTESFLEGVMVTH